MLKLHDRLVYEKQGIQIIVNREGLTFKKNGLTIAVPNYIMEDFAKEFKDTLDAEDLAMIEQIRNFNRNDSTR